MDGGGDIYGYLLSDEPTPEEHAQAMGALMRQRQAADEYQNLGLLGVTAGERHLAQSGNALMQAAQTGYGNVQHAQQQLAQAGDKRLQRDALDAWRKAQLAKPETQLTTTPDGVTLAVDKKDPTNVTTIHTATKRLGKPGAGGNGVGGDPLGGMKPETIDMLAWGLLDNIQPKVMRGPHAQAQLTAIQNRAAELQKDADISGNAAEYKANGKALAALMEQKSKTDILENTAMKNLDVAVREAAGLTDMGAGILNLPVQEAQKRLGSEQWTRYNTARLAAVGEAGKLLNGAIGTGGLSEGARHEVEQLIQPGATFGQIKAAVDIIKADLRNRQAAADEQIKGLQSRASRRRQSTGGSGGSGPTPAAPPGGMSPVQQRIAQLKASGVTDPSKIKAQLKEERLIP